MKATVNKKAAAVAEVVSMPVVRPSIFVANDVASCLYDFEDGRVFRDTTWSYSALYESVTDKQLVSDCKTAMNNSRSD